MTFSVRRIVTTHDADGNAIAGIDTEIQAKEGRPGTGIHGTVLWVTDSMPVDMSGDEDTALRKVDIAPGPNGSIFRIIEFPAGCEPYRHRTDTIDYVLVLKGEIDMEMDGTEVHMNEGDTMIQRGTVHAWTNRGSEPCRVAFILIDGKL